MDILGVSQEDDPGGWEKLYFYSYFSEENASVWYVAKSGNSFCSLNV